MGLALIVVVLFVLGAVIGLIVLSFNGSKGKEKQESAMIQPTYKKKD